MSRDVGHLVVVIGVIGVALSWITGIWSPVWRAVRRVALVVLVNRVTLFVARVAVVSLIVLTLAAYLGLIDIR